MKGKIDAAIVMAPAPTRLIAGMLNAAMAQGHYSIFRTSFRRTRLILAFLNSSRQSGFERIEKCVYKKLMLLRSIRKAEESFLLKQSTYPIQDCGGAELG